MDIMKPRHGYYLGKPRLIGYYLGMVAKNTVKMVMTGGWSMALDLPREYMGFEETNSWGYH